MALLGLQEVHLGGISSQVMVERVESKDLKNFWRQRRCPDGLLPVDFGYSLSTIRKGVRKQSDTGMRSGETVGLLKSDIILDTDTPHLNLIPHPWRRLKTTASERKIPLVSASSWSAKRIKLSDTANQFAFPRYRNQQSHNSNSASAALNKWLRTHAPEGCVVHSFRHSMRDS